MLKSSLFLLCVSAIIMFSCESEPMEPVVVDCSISGLSLIISEATETGCGSPDGSITVSATGGTAEYEYKLDNGNYQSSPVFQNLSSGLYTLMVKDKNGCEATVQGTVTSSSGPSITAATATLSGCGTSNGSITLNVEGGSGDIQYKINGGVYGSSPVFTELEAGLYEVVVKDALGCESFSEVHVLTGMPFENIKDVINRNCAVSGCHVSGTGVPNFSLNDNIVANSSNIATRTANGSMPPQSSGLSLTQDEKDEIACWVADGANIN